MTTRSGRALVKLVPQSKGSEGKGKALEIEASKSSRPQGIPKYTKFVKDIVANKSKLAEFEFVALTEECSSRILNKVKHPTKQKDPGCFIVQVTIGKYSKTRGLYDPARPDGIIEYVLVKVGSLIFPIDFVGIDFEPDLDISFILGHLFLAIGGALIDMAAAKDPLERVNMGQDIEEDVEVKELASVLDMPNVNMLRKNMEPLNIELGPSPKSSLEEAPNLS
ncbi:uncharacterized protein LOC129875712 [Solanum dulcamara]|uniref:uncharacterized protein LOC129875712 n=1 Tax=Solanum dulcamara TaxID=45834 RepID=UPI0024855B6D|nr:uncharacterized protein LOC129875712 [Solanum dulcamara]